MGRYHLQEKKRKKETTPRAVACEAGCGCWGRLVNTERKDNGPLHLVLQVRKGAAALIVIVVPVVAVVIVVIVPVVAARCNHHHHPLIQLWYLVPCAFTI